MGYDPHIELAQCLALPLSEGAARQLLHPLPALAAMIAAEPRCTVAVSDVHGWHERLTDVLDELGLIDARQRRIPGPTTLIQIGDGIDGRRYAGDLATLQLILEVFDRFLVGNHEAAYLRGGPRFAGQPFVVELEAALEAAAARGRIVAAHVEADVLFTHAGVDPRILGLKRAAGAAGRLERVWGQWLGARRNSPRPLFAIEAARGGASPYGGILWQDWRSLLAAPRTHYRQVMGHSPLGWVESDPDERLFCFDLGGARLGVCVCWPDGRLVFGSDVVPDDQREPGS